MAKNVNIDVAKLTIIGLSCLAVVAVIVVLVVKKLKEGKEEREYESDLEKEAKSTKGDRTLTDLEVKEIANTLYTSMKGFGTDEKAFYNAFERIANSADWVAIKNTFGIRDGETLQQWIIGDFSNRKRINNHLSTIGVSERI